MRPACVTCGPTSCGWYYPTERAAEKNEVIACPKCNRGAIENDWNRTRKDLT